ncbi:hypothetical protein K1T71_003568 [Dendrolimus kikuchii]|uniref:Uncharacterized protein n=1 Tax=Dendrolimus kikuchii TaxID=765133 RepID=A0ACC1DCZ4_9NEOP|nr:hypothetical protein K1T71_003568 [Dendrolimus kikuchii]
MFILLLLLILYFTASRCVGFKVQTDSRKFGPRGRPVILHLCSINQCQWRVFQSSDSHKRSKTLATDFAPSCSVDKTIKTWDTRAAPHKACMLTAENAHQSDINASLNSKEPSIASVDDELKNLPPQLQIHQGQTDIKELHWHKQIPSVMVTTGSKIFKTSSV